MECGGDERKQKRDETGMHNQSGSLEVVHSAVPVSKSPASFPVGSLPIFMVEEGVTKLPLTASEFIA